MRIFPAPLDIGDKDGFGQGRDLFQRADIGQGLANLIGSVEDPIVLAIDGQWGSGKTTFLKMWAGLLRQQGFPVIYFDAFENDYSEDAFTALAAEIIGLLDAEKKRGEPQGKAFLKKAIGAGKVLARSALKVGVKAATAGALNAADFTDLADAVSDQTEELTDKYIGELLTKQAQRRDTIHAFKDALRDLPGLLAPVAAVTDGEIAVQQKPLVFIIDELDRCRPLFALEMLERIKHFFSVPNVHFVLGTHVGQLEACVKAAYGESIDAHNYLEKFIQVRYALVDGKRNVNELDTTKCIQDLAKRLHFADADNDFMESSTDFIIAASVSLSLSFRTIERVMSALALAVAYTKKTNFRPGPIFAGLCILRVMRPDLYHKAKRGTLNFSEIDKYFEFEKMDVNEKKLFSHWAINIWRYCSDLYADDEIIKRLDPAMASYSISNRMSILQMVTNRFIDTFHSS